MRPAALSSSSARYPPRSKSSRTFSSAPPGCRASTRRHRGSGGCRWPRPRAARGSRRGCASRRRSVVEHHLLLGRVDEEPLRRLVHRAIDEEPADLGGEHDGLAAETLDGGAEALLRTAESVVGRGIEEADAAGVSRAQRRLRVLLRNLAGRDCREARRRSRAGSRRGGGPCARSDLPCRLLSPAHPPAAIAVAVEVPGSDALPPHGLDEVYPMERQSLKYAEHATHPPCGQRAARASSAAGSVGFCGVPGTSSAKTQDPGGVATLGS